MGFGELDAIGVQHGTELSSLGHDALSSWEPLLPAPRFAVMDILEIGVGAGASLRTWRDWFPQARLVGLDARRIALDPPITNCRIALGSQTDLSALRPLLREHRFRLIVDHGSRKPADQIFTFLSIFPWLEPDSVYICARFDGEERALIAAGIDEADQTARPDAKSEPPRLSPVSAPDWFAALGALTASRSGHGRRVDPPTPIEQVLSLITSLTLFPGSAVIRS